MDESSTAAFFGSLMIVLRRTIPGALPVVMSSSALLNSLSSNLRNGPVYNLYKVLSPSDFDLTFFGQ